MYDRNQLIDLIRKKALRHGEFTLASGRKASYYLDCRLITLDSVGAKLIAEGMLDVLADDMPDLIGGMAVGADPITGAVVALAGLREIPLRGLIVRKEAKGHGTGKHVEGPYTPGESVVIVEDVVTTGGSALAAIDRCQEAGLTVRRILAVVDRLEGGREAFQKRGYDLTTLLTVRDLGQ
jgi:orotate phosphoribosyltransferase